MVEPQRSVFLGICLMPFEDLVIGFKYWDYRYAQHPMLFTIIKNRVQAST